MPVGVVLDEARRQAMRAEVEVEHMLDLNGDGVVGWDDITEVGRRVERAVLRRNLPFATGVAAGASVNLLF